MPNEFEAALQHNKSKKSQPALAQEGHLMASHDSHASTPQAYVPKMYRVGNRGGKQVSWDGYVTFLVEGVIISESGYSKEGIVKLRTQGLELTEI